MERMKKQIIRKAVAGMLAFIIGISVLMITLIPLLIYLNTSSGETLKAMGMVREFQSQRSRESLDIVYDATSSTFLLKNTGTTPITIILAAISSGDRCGNLSKTNISLNPGDTVKNISNYGLDSICYVVTSRGNVFPVKERYNILLSQLSQSSQEIVFASDNTKFAEDLYNSYKNKIIAKYNTDRTSCTNDGTPKLHPFDKYNNKKLLTINSTSDDVVSYEKDYGCFSLTFQNVVNVSGNQYAVAVFYKIVIVLINKNGNKLGAVLMVCLQKDSVTKCANSAGTSWTPSAIQTDYIVLEGLSLIPMQDAPSGLYNLNITLTFDSQGSTKFNVGVEYIALQNARLVTG